MNRLMMMEGMEVPGSAGNWKTKKNILEGQCRRTSRDALSSRKGGSEQSRMEEDCCKSNPVDVTKGLVQQDLKDADGGGSSQVCPPGAG